MKKIKVLVLLSSLFLFVGFGNCLTLNLSDDPGIYDFRILYNHQGTIDLKQYYGDSDGVGCLFVSSSDRCTFFDGDSTYSLGANIAYCSDSDTFELSCSSRVDITYYNFLSESAIKQFYPDYTSLQCQTEYNLIPISSVDSEYCTSNGLCPSSSGSDVDDNWSALYINDIQHPSAGVIDISIPEEFEWNYTGNDELFELDVVGYNTDPDYIAGIITTQKTTPNNQDFNNIISGLIPLLVPGLVIILFIYFVFRFIKKIF